MSKEDFQRLKANLDIDHIDQLDPKYKDKCRMILSTFENLNKNKNVEYINTRKAENLLTFFGQEKQRDGFKELPENCCHVRISYFIWSDQGKNGEDATAIGRKIKKMYYLTKDEKEEKGGREKIEATTRR